MLWLLTVIAACVTAEFLGYWLHRLLHTQWVPWLAKAHMDHHRVDYGPGMPLRSDEYMHGARSRTAVFGVGLEWFAPGAVLFFALLGILILLGVPALYQVVFFGTLLGWTAVFFNYMHDLMHVRGAWPLKVPLLRRWFRNARRLHDHHHTNIACDGSMYSNYGICFFWLDRVFRTLSG